MSQFTFALTAVPGHTEKAATLLAESIRKYAGRFADNSICIIVPDTGTPLSEDTCSQWQSLGVNIEPLPLEPEVLAFPFAAKVLAAAKAESISQTNCLVWMDSDSVIIQEPAALVLPAEKVLGYRPVDHTLIGSPYDEAVDDFWSLIYARCRVPDGRIFPTTASVDERQIRPYFNAGMLVVRPEVGLLRAWRDDFLRLYQDPIFTPFYKRHPLYRIFIHQAVLAGTILRQVEPDSLYPLSHSVNYPLHMHDDYPAARRPQVINELISCRYDTFFDDPDWRDRLPAADPLRGWLFGKLD